MWKVYIILLMFTLSGCTINQADLQAAIDVCESHGGIYSITPDSPGVDVYCRDGVYFDDVNGD